MQRLCTYQWYPSLPHPRVGWRNSGDFTEYHVQNPSPGLICSDPNKINILEQKHHGDSENCLRQIFVEDFINKKPQKYSQDWNGLIELLGDVDLETLAEKVGTALEHSWL